MKTKNNENVLPRALQEVWEWKESVQRDMAGLDTRQMLARMHADADKVCVAYDLIRANPAKECRRVAESGASYGKTASV